MKRKGLKNEQKVFVQETSDGNYAQQWQKGFRTSIFNSIGISKFLVNNNIKVFGGVYEI